MDNEELYERKYDVETEEYPDEYLYYNEDKEDVSDDYDFYMSDSEQFEEEDDYNEEEFVENNNDSDWSIDGLDKTYPNEEFDIKKCQDLYFSFKDDSSEFDEKKQCEAVRYANYFAKKGDDNAKNFIVSVIQKGSGEAARIAGNSLNLFLRNYVRHEVERFYARLPISDADRCDRCPEAIQECFVYICKQIHNYDPSKGKITTFFCSKIIYGIVSEYEAKRRGRKSKQTMKVDKVVSNAYKELVAEGYQNPTIRQLSMKTGKNVEAIMNSRARIVAENTMVAFDSTDPGNPVSLKKNQSTYDNPEEYAERKDHIEALIKKLDSLSDLERELFLASNGLCIENGEIVECNTKSMAVLSEEYDMKVNEVKHTINTATRKLKNRILMDSGKEIDKHDKLLSGRKILFINDEKDKEDDGLDDIIEVK